MRAISAVAELLVNNDSEENDIPNNYSSRQDIQFQLFRNLNGIYAIFDPTLRGLTNRSSPLETS